MYFSEILFMGFRGFKVYIVLSFLTERPGQPLQTQIRLPLEHLHWDVPSAPFGEFIFNLNFSYGTGAPVSYAPVICIHGPHGAGDTGDIAGLKCQNLTSDVSRQCRGCAGVLISR